MKPTLASSLALLMLLSAGMAACSSDAAVPAATEPVIASTTLERSSSTSATANPTAATTSTKPGLEATEELAGRDALAFFATQAELDIVIGIVDGPAAVMWNAGQLIDLPFDSEQVDWSDGEFIYNYDWSDEENKLITSTASTFDGIVVCEADGPIHHITRRADQTLVMAVEPNYADRANWNGEGDYAVPLNAVDCQTGFSQPIEPILYYAGEVEWTFIERIAGRVFTGHGDAEGNADVLNEQGISVNGDDYAGFHAFSADASAVVYGDMSINGPHLSPLVVARETKGGDELWRTQFDMPFISLSFINGMVAVGFHDDVERVFGRGGALDRIRFLDAITGNELFDVPVGFDLIYAG